MKLEKLIIALLPKTQKYLGVTFTMSISNQCLVYSRVEETQHLRSFYLHTRLGCLYEIKKCAKAKITIRWCCMFLIETLLRESM